MNLTRPGILHLRIVRNAAGTDADRQYLRQVFNATPEVTQIINVASEDLPEFFRVDGWSHYVGFSYCGGNSWSRYLPEPTRLQDFLKWLLPLVQVEPGQVLGYYWEDDTPAPVILRAREAVELPQHVPGANPPIPDMAVIDDIPSLTQPNRVDVAGDNGWGMLFPGIYTERSDLNDEDWRRVCEYYYQSPYGDITNLRGFEDFNYIYVSQINEKVDQANAVNNEMDMSRVPLTGEHILEVLRHTQAAASYLTLRPGDYVDARYLEADVYEKVAQRFALASQPGSAAGTNCDADLSVLYLDQNGIYQRAVTVPTGELRELVAAEVLQARVPLRKGDWIVTEHLPQAVQVAISTVFETAGCPYVGSRTEGGPCNPGYKALYWDANDKQSWTATEDAPVLAGRQLTPDLVLGGWYSVSDCETAAA